MTKQEMFEALKNFEDTSLQYKEGAEPQWTAKEWLEFEKEFFALKKELRENPKAGEEEFEAKSNGMKLHLEEMKAWGDLE